MAGVDFMVCELSFSKKKLKKMHHSTAVTFTSLGFKTSILFQLNISQIYNMAKMSTQFSH